MNVAWIVVPSLILFAAVYGIVLFHWTKEVKALKIVLAELERRQGQGSKIPDEAIRRLADPATLDAELERAGQLSDMRRARRAHLIRPDAGPPAKVRKMRITRK